LERWYAEWKYANKKLRRSRKCGDSQIRRRQRTEKKTKEEEGEEEKIRHQAIRIIVRLVFLVFGSWLILNATTVSDANGKAKQHTCCYVDITASVCCCC
tara:strand:+ start:286 stop:582 length:297 start_codon:yes stop_codon:yes gene_type:complete